MSGLQVEHISKAFGSVQAVRDVSLSVPAGGVLGLIGPNGAGKTTTMRSVLRIVRPDAGSLTWMGKPVADWPIPTFGYLPEERGLYPKMEGEEQMRFFGRLHGIPEAEIGRRIEEWRDRFGLEDALGKRVEQLSRGNAQKLQFLAAIIHSPPLLVLDEAFSGLDPVNTQLLRDAVRLLHERGSTIVFSSHRMDHVEELCDRVCLIAGGRTVVHGGVDEVRRATGRRVLRVAWERGTLEAARNISGVGVRLTRANDREAKFELDAAVAPEPLLQQAIKLGGVRRFEVDYPSLEQLYIEVVGHGEVAASGGPVGRAEKGGVSA